ncbi:MAG: hypothetical protein ACJA0Q_000812 [Saprospiraceae bacterium]|jgi:hypothetical protein
MTQLKYFLKFSLFVFLISGALLLIHLFVFSTLGHGFDEAKIFTSYSLSAVLSSASFLLLIIGSKKFAGSLGFAFMWTSFIKFGVYLFVFKLIFVLDSDPRGIDLSMLLVPYLSTLFFEVYYVAKLLKD